MKKTICTIGFAKKSLETFVQLLKSAGVTRLVDTRLNNTSQLAGFAKKQDLDYILRLVGIEYVHEPMLAPTEALLKQYKKKEIDWPVYEQAYVSLLQQRAVEPVVMEHVAGHTICFLCSEDKAHHCHRRLLAEYMQQQHPGDFHIQHLG